MKKIFLLISHGAMLGIGFSLGVYMLPILIAPESPSQVEVQAQARNAVYQARFMKDLAGSDFLHWAEGDVTLTDQVVTFMGEAAPGPDYKLYLAPSFVENEAQFLEVKAQSVQLGDVKTFDQFIVPLNGINPDNYTTVVLWCETFGEFISAAQYR